jgi:hypothetical protein
MQVTDMGDPNHRAVIWSIHSKTRLERACWRHKTRAPVFLCEGFSGEKKLRRGEEGLLTRALHTSSVFVAASRLADERRHFDWREDDSG